MLSSFLVPFEMTSMYSTPTIAIIELEKSILNMVMMGCESLHYGRLGQEEEIRIKKRLRESVDEELYFSSEFYRDVWGFYRSEILQLSFPNFFAVSSHFCKHSRYASLQNHAQEYLKDILTARNIEYAGYPLSELIGILKQENNTTKIQRIAEELASAKIPDLKNQKYEELHKSLGGILQKHKEKEEDIIKDIVAESATMSGLERVVLKKNLRQQYGFSAQEIEEALNVTSNKRQIPQVSRLCDFLQKDFGASNWVYAGLLPANSLTLLVGDSGAGKTILAYECLLSYLEGKSFLGEPASVLANNPKKRGLIINSDQPPQQAQEILANQVRSSYVGQICEIIEYGWCLDDLPQLELLIQNCGYTFVVLDSYIGIHKHMPNFDENSTYARIAVERLQELAHRYGVTILAIHHSNKSADNRGIHKASGNKFITSTASCQWNLTKAEQDPTIKNFAVPKIRNSPEVAYTLQFDSHTCTHNVIAGLDKRIHATAENVHCVFKNHQKRSNQPLHLTINDIAKNFNRTGERTNHTIQKALFLLEQRGIIKKEIHPTDSTQRIYSLREQPAPAPLLTSDLVEEIIEENTLLQEDTVEF